MPQQQSLLQLKKSTLTIRLENELNSVHLCLFRQGIGTRLTKQAAQVLRDSTLEVIKTNVLNILDANGHELFEINLKSISKFVNKAAGPYANKAAGHKISLSSRMSRGSPRGLLLVI